MPTFKVDNKAVNLIVEGAAGKLIPEADVIQRLLNLAQRPIGLLPPIVRWISPYSRWIILERPPHVETIIYRSIKAASAAGSGKEWTFKIPLPWTLELMSLDQDFYPATVTVYTSPTGSINQSLVGQPVGALPLPNFYCSSSICLPPRQYNESVSDIGSAIMLGHKLAFEGGWNQDTMQALQQATKTRKPAALLNDLKQEISPATIYTAWEEHTVEDVLTWDWPSVVGFGTHVTEQDNIISTLDEVITCCLDSEAQLLQINNPALYLNSALQG